MQIHAWPRIDRALLIYHVLKDYFSQINQNVSTFFNFTPFCWPIYVFGGSTSENQLQTFTEIVPNIDNVGAIFSCRQTHIAYECATQLPLMF